MKKKLLKFGIFGALFLLLVAVIYFQDTLSPTLKINEVSFRNGSDKDWIELYNPSLNTSNLKGLFLTDNKSKKTKFKIKDDIAVGPKEFFVIGGKKADKNKVTINVNFGLKDGETLYLIALNGIDIIDSLQLNVADGNATKTIGRFPDGSDDVFNFSTSTKGANNKITK